MLKPRIGIYHKEQNKKISLEKITTSSFKWKTSENCIFKRESGVFVVKKLAQNPRVLHYVLKKSKFKTCINTSL